MAFFPEKVASLRVDNEKAEIGFGKTLFGQLSISADVTEFSNGWDFTCHIQNGGSDNSPLITEFYGLDITLPCSHSARWESLRGDDCSGQSFAPLSRNLEPGDTLKMAPVGGRSSNGAFPFFDITIDGKPYVFGLGWSGQWFYRIERTEDNIHIVAGQEECAYYLRPGESARSVRVLLYSGEGDIGDNRLGFREAFRKLNRTYIANPQFTMPIACQVFDRYYWNNTQGFRAQEPQLDLIARTAATPGHDTFWIDALWFRDAFPSGVGNYEFEKGFPDGFLPIADACHKAGLKLMVWFEPERVDCESDTFKKFGDEDGKYLLKFPGCERNRLLNLADPDAVQWISDTVIRFMKDNSIDIFRTDYNLDPLPYWQANDAPGRKGILEMHYIEGLYRFWDNIARAFPGIMIDNCASGGRRLDVETLARSVSCWRSDLGCRNEDAEYRYYTWSQNISALLPRYLPFQQNQIWSPDAYCTRSAMSEGTATAFAMLDPAYDPTLPTTAVAEVLRFRPWRRAKPLALTPVTNREDCWFAYTLTQNGEGCALAFRRDSCKEKEFLLRLPEIDTGCTYECMLSDEQRCEKKFQLPGRQLAEGILLTCRGDGRESFILTYCKAQEKSAT